MTNEEAIRMIERIKDRINWEVVDSQKKMDALNMAIKSLEAWGKLINQIQLTKTMKENELPIAGDLTTAYILRGEIDMLECTLALITGCLAELEVQNER